MAATLHVKKDDVVVVLWGADKGKSGKVLATYPRKNRVLVEGVNLVRKTLRRSEDKPKGGIVTKEAPLPIAKVMRQDRYEARQKKRGVTAATT